jgi:hypothetical protein
LRYVREFERYLYPSLQIFGGGLLIMSVANELGSGSDPLTMWAAALLCVIGFVGALLSLKWLDRDPRVARWCFVFWTLQVVAFACPVFSYTFYCGAQFPLVFGLDTLSVSIESPHLGMGVIARIDREGPISYLGVNLIALGACRFFLREWRNPLHAGGKLS